MIEKIKEFWDKLPKTAKVFCYVFISYTLKTIAVELGVFEDNAFAGYLVGLINIVLVFIQEAAPVVADKLKK